jgi:hypothetical protein
MSDCWREFDVAVGQWRLGELMAERLPVVAVKSLGDTEQPHREDVPTHAQRNCLTGKRR